MQKIRSNQKFDVYKRGIGHRKEALAQLQNRIKHMKQKGNGEKLQAQHAQQIILDNQRSKQ